MGDVGDAAGVAPAGADTDAAEAGGAAVAADVAVAAAADDE